MHPPDAEKIAYTTQAILLQCDAFWFEERQSNLPKTGDKDISTTDQRYSHQIQRTPRSYEALQETFELPRTNDIKLNPLNFVFRVSLGKFLGFMVTQKGIKANPIQLGAIMGSHTPTFKKRVQ